MAKSSGQGRGSSGKKPAAKAKPNKLAGRKAGAARGTRRNTPAAGSKKPSSKQMTAFNQIGARAEARVASSNPITEEATERLLELLGLTQSDAKDQSSAFSVALNDLRRGGQELQVAGTMLRLWHELKQELLLSGVDIKEILLMEAAIQQKVGELTDGAGTRAQTIANAIGRFGHTLAVRRSDAKEIADGLKHRRLDIPALQQELRNIQEQKGEAVTIEVMRELGVGGMAGVAVKGAVTSARKGIGGFMGTVGALIDDLGQAVRGEGEEVGAGGSGRR